MTTVAAPTAGPTGYRASCTAPVWARLTGLLALPMAWLVLLYLVPIVLLFITAFWTTDSFTGATAADLHPRELPAGVRPQPAVPDDGPADPRGGGGGDGVWP